ncbi:nucleolar MIF4G domain-containing protein 1 [Bacillus rossius redtenbacheri]|uniref:nucleolar MIF4G domain-containing protein 1 n=1 Tax=Bacillus rossius redtenbacheri TaxID=93214 RepID=UPI002FDCAF2A
MKFKRKVKSKNSSGKKENNAVKTRKELRKQSRKEKKAKKHAFFQKKKAHLGKIPVAATNKDRETHNVSSLKVKQRTASQSVGTPEPKHRVSLEEQQHLALKRKEKQEDRRKKQYQKNRVQQLKAANEEEDKMIKKLAKQLNLHKRKQKTVPKSFSSDGLDYLLEVCDEEGRQNAVSAEKTFIDNSDSEFEEDLALVTGKVVKRPKSESLLEADDVGDTAMDSDGSGGDSDSEDNGFDSDAEQGSDSYGESVGSFSDDDERQISGASVLKNSKKEKRHDKLVKMEKEKRKEKPGSFDHQQDSDGGDDEDVDDFTTSVPVLHKLEKVKKGKAGKQLNGVSEVAKQRTAVKRRLASCGESGDDETINVKQKKKKELQVSERKGNLAQAPASKATGVKKKSVRFEDEQSGEGEETEDEGVGHESDGGVWEDIYGRTRDKKGNVVQMGAQGKYVPPHLREQTGGGDAKKREQLLRLRKQLKGLLNRLAESNMNSIAQQLDELYMSNSRNDMNETLTQLVLESLISPVLAPERLVMEQVMLVAILHANVGSEVGAHFMQVLIKKFELLNSQCQEVEKKELDNVVLTLCHLYNFRVFHCTLVFDILERLVERFGEKETELILVVLRSVGFTLRKDDPSALKDFILRVQRKAAAGSHADGSRVNFMLDVLLAIKNNNMSKIPNYDTSHSEHLKKLLKSFLRKGNYVTELKISLEDLLKAEERGRWWVVGSAWTGVLPGEGQGGGAPGAPPPAALAAPTQYSHQLLELARKQRMNTDVRRNVFCILMTAEDYLDAFEKLLRLGLKNQQEREIVYVLLHCCLQEKNFNPYYGFLAQKFCDFDRKYQMTLQFSLWDKFKELQTFNQQQTTNLAKLLTHLLLEKGLPISVLKVVEFTNVDKATVRLLRQTLLGVLLAPGEDASLQVFLRVSQSAKLRVFCESLRLFVHHLVLKNTAGLPEADCQLLTRRARLADSLLSASEHRLAL